MGRAGIIVHALRPAAVELAREASAWLVERGHEVRLSQSDADGTGLQQWSCADDVLAKDLDVVVSLGGDGTMLRAVDLVSRAGVPVLGINVGHLGYLTECESVGWSDALERFFSGDYEIEERMTLDVVADTTDGPVNASALNDAWVERRESGHTVRLAVSVGGHPFTTYAVDGLIVASPTGSTAYNLSARGPVLSPTLDALVLTPVSPHQLFDLSLVLDPTETVRVEVVDDRPARLLIDGRPAGELHQGNSVTCGRGARPARLVTFRSRNFHAILKAKFGLTDR